MGTTRIRLESENLPIGRIDEARVDATTEEEIAFHKAIDDAEAMRDAGRHVRRIRKRLGMTQPQFAKTFDLSLDTIRNWEQGRRFPTGPAKALLRILDRSPEAALEALGVEH
jgi:putative transcriptional regulator